MNATPPPAPPDSLIAATLAFLRQYPPFDGMEAEPLRFAAARLSLAYYPKGTPLFEPARGKPDHLFVIQRGLVQRVEGDPGGNAPITTLRAGECFPIGALVEGSPGDSTFTAAADTFCYQLPAADFGELLRRSSRFHDFATRRLASLLNASRRQLAMRAASSAWEQQAMTRSLRSLIRREPVCCAPETTVGEALRAMSAARVGSILVVDRGGSLTGIVTRRDVLERVALPGRKPGEPVSSVMTPRPKTLPAEASAHEAAVLIAREGIRHVPVMDGGGPIGVVAEHDLFTLQQVTARGINQMIANAGDEAALRQAAGEIRTLARDLLVQGLDAEHATLIISTLNDALTRRIIELEQARQGVDGIEWCWLAFGSEGRYEQTVSTDQDNGIVFDAGPAAANDVRAALLPLAHAVNRTLDACGFPLCKGNIMAGNPQCCLSLEEWRQQFADWIHAPAGQQLLNAVIFFDFRPLHGAERLANTLRASLLDMAASRPAFLHELARYALEAGPPLGLFSEFDTEDAPGAPGTIDLKKSGARLFVDAARVLALAASIPHTNTAERLRQAGARLGMGADEVASATEAFFFIQTLRLRGQLAGDRRQARASPNRLDPARLNEVDRRILKESFRQARKLQSRLALDYQL